MSTITISHDTALDHDAIRFSIDEVFDELAAKFDIAGEWQTDSRFVLTGDAIEGSIDVLPGRVEVNVSLGVFLLPFKRAIESQVREQLFEKLP